MSSQPLGLTPEELLRQDRWLRQLVRGLVGESLVDDVVQDTWASTLSSKQAVERPRAWLAVVAGNFARRARRTGSRRSQREERAARAESVPSTQETLELIELQGQVLSAVRRLREPYATSLLLRYTHGFSMGEIAERTGVSEAAVRQRIKRGLDILREGLADSCGEDWQGAPALAAWLIPGAIQMKKSLWVGAVAAAFLALGSLGVRALKPGVVAEESEPSMAVLWVPDLAQDPSSVGLGMAAVDGTQERRVVGEDPAPIAVPAKATSLRGCVIDSLGQPMARVEIALTSHYPDAIWTSGLKRDEIIGRTGADGTFEVPAPDEGTFIIPGAGWVPIALRHRQEPESDVLFVAAPAVEFSGVVVDGSDEPIVGVVSRVVGVGLKHLSMGLEGIRLLAWQGDVSDASGRFRHACLPAMGARLRFEKEGFIAREIEIGALDSIGVTVVLETELPAYRLSGWVLAPTGAPVEGARVGLGERSTHSAANGSFELSFFDDQIPMGRDSLWAASPPWRTKVLPSFGAQLLAAPGAVLEIEILFEGESLALAGTVVSADGQPAAGLLVYLWRQEELVDRLNAEELATSRDREVLDFGPGIRVWTKTDAQGRFRLEGLRDRQYPLRIFDRSRYTGMTTEALQAGQENLRLFLRDDFRREMTNGRVLDEQGAGVVGASVRWQLPIYSSTGRVELQGPSEGVLTDADGRFKLAGVSGGFVQLIVTGVGIMPAHRSVLADDSGTGLEVRVSRICRFQLTLRDERTTASNLQVLDGNGQALPIAAFGGGEYGWSSWRQIKDGATRVLSVGQSAATLVLYGDKLRELARLPLALQPDELEQIDW